MVEQRLKEICEQNPDVATAVALELLRQVVDSNKNLNGNASTIDELLKEIQLALSNKPKQEPVEISVVLPVFNEAENLSELYRRLSETLSQFQTYEILFVNDGSTDRSAEIITEIHTQDSRVKLLNFSRNFGHQAAISAGVDYSKGNAVVLMDADLQDPPELLTTMLEMWRGGAEVVYAVRQNRKEFFLKRAAYFSFYRILQKLANIDIPLDSGDFCLMDKKVVNHLKALPEKTRFIRGLRSWVGYKQVALQYERDERHAGVAKYTFKKLVKLAFDGIISFSSFPLRLASYVGFLTCLAGALYLLFAVGFFIFKHTAPAGWTSIIAIILIVGGMQLLVLGVVGEYIARIYDESKQRPTYLVSSFLD